MRDVVRVLYLEDNPYDKELVEEILKAEGIVCDIIWVDNREKYLQALEQEEFGLILSDNSLPTFDGMSALKLARQKHANVPFIFVSGTIGEEVAIESFKKGATDYVLKHHLSKLGYAIVRALDEEAERAERRRADERIREQAALLDIVPDAILVCSLEGNILFWNKGAAQIYGWTEAEAKGQTIHKLLFKDDSSLDMEAQKTIIEQKEWQGELFHTNKFGKELIVQSRWTLMCDKEGQPKSILVVNSNITEKKQMEAQFLRNQRMETIGTLASGIAHDLNNVFAPILMVTQLLEKKVADDRSRQLLNILDTTIQRGASLVKQVLSFGRGVESQQTIVQLRHLIREIEKIAKETFPKSISLRANVPNDLWTLSADATQMHQILMNLCVNGRDAMPDGGTLSITAEDFLIDANYEQMHPDAKAGPYIVLTVSDTGTGITPEVLTNIFEPFFTTKEVNKGTGLGLSTVASIVKSYNGFINVQSQVGQGTQFKIYLPALQTQETQQAKTESQDLPIGKEQLILVVDDEASIREITKATLEVYGYKVLTASDGIEAIAVYAQHKDKITVVITDLMMPTMDGSIMIRALQRINAQIKIIINTGLKSDGGIIKKLPPGIHATLSKPYTAEELLKTLDKVISM